MKFVLKLAGIPILVHHQYDFIAALCRGYTTQEEPAFAVSTTDEQIAAEVELNGGVYSSSICEATCLHREIAKGLVSRGIILMHSAVIAVDGVAYVFMAKSGVGKSTHIRLWQQVFGSRAVVVNGDKPMFSFCGDTLMAHGSPWRGKEGLGENIALPVGGICLLERGQVNAIQPATPAQVVQRVFHQVLIPDDSPNMELFMDMMDKIIQTVPFYRLSCNMQPEAAMVAYQGMVKP